MTSRCTHNVDWQDFYPINCHQALKRYLEQSIQDWTKRSVWKVAFKNLEVIWSSTGGLHNILWLKCTKEATRRCYIKKVLWKFFSNFIRKHLCGSRLQACNSVTKGTSTHVFSREFCEIVKSTFFIEQLQSLFLNVLPSMLATNASAKFAIN